jgi:homoserine kinase type II
VAVTINDWCGTGDGALNESLARPLLTAYHKIRLMTTGERDAWPVMLRAASLRFWLSRLYDLHFPRPGEITHTKDPDVFKRILVYHIDHEYDVHGLWPDGSKQRGLG